MKNKKIKQFMKILNVFMFLFCFLPLNIYTNMGNIQNISENDLVSEEQDLTYSPQTQEEIAPIIEPITIIGNNVSQFNVSESIISQAPFIDQQHGQKSILDIDNENMTLEVPEGWIFEQEHLNISALYKSHELLNDNNITIGDPWTAVTNYPKDSDSSFGFNNYISNEKLVIEGIGEPENPLVPYQAYSEWTQEISKPSDDHSIWETDFIYNGDTQHPIWEEFNEDPEWGKNYDNPYGGVTETATVDLQWNVGNLGAYIKAGTSQYTLGNPSIAWETNFGWETSFLPKKVELIVGWRVENLGYEEGDNFAVICQVDGNYVDGRVDTNGVPNSNASATTIEYDNETSKIGTHDFIYRIFDITDIINSNLVDHSLNFGIWMENIDETDDEVRVIFDLIAIRAVEEDQYKIGELSFECSVKDFKTSTDLNYWLLFAFLGDSGTSEEIFYPLSWLNDDFTSGSVEQTVNFQYNLTSRFKNILNSNDTISSAIGIINLNPFKTYKDDFLVMFDNISLKPIYKVDNLATAGFQRYNGTDWNSQTEFEITTKDPYDDIKNEFILAFQVTNPDYNGSTLEFESLMYINKLNENKAEASYFVNDIDDEPIYRIQWNVTFNNSITFDQLLIDIFLLENYNPIGYNFTINDLPAWDNLGKNSVDWNWTGGWDPLGRRNPNYAQGIRTNGTANSGHYQNLTIADATAESPQDEGSYINGTWIASFTSPNYLSNLKIEHLSGISPRFYNLNNTNIIANQTSPDEGHYNISIRNASGAWLNNFPKYFPSESDNLTTPWIVNDSMGVGNYQIIGMWNDTNASTSQTLRIGVRTTYFEMWRTSIATLKSEPGIINSGDLGEFYFSFSQSDGTPLSFAENYVRIYNNATNNTWGTDWPPYVYLIDRVYEDPSLNAEGNYTLSFKTRSVPVDDYEVYIMIRKPFFDYQRLNSWINLTGYPINLNITYGATNTSIFSAYMDSYNIPYVNDASRSIIQVNITNHTNQFPLENAIISGKFNGSENVFYGIEVYRETQNIVDKGLYNITIDATGLNATDSGQYNYTLTISASVDGYDSTYIEISTEILPILTDIDATSISVELYEGGNFEFYANYRNVLDQSNPLPLNDANLTWALIYASNSSIALSGNFSFIFSGVYHTEIVLETETEYVLPGIYDFMVNASKYNCANASWIQIGLEIFSKNSTKIYLNVPENIRIGSSLDIQFNLMMINGSSIPDSDLFITITYASTDIFNIVETTDSNGIATFSQIVPYNYADDSIEINVTYYGNSTVKGSLNSTIKTILGKIPVSLSLIYTSEERVGYDITIDGTINITDVTQYSGIYLTLISWYDGNFLNPTFIQQIAVDQNGSLSYYLANIADGHDNITFFMDYAGTSTVEYASVEKTFDVLPKWDVVLNVTELADTLTMGQEIQLNISANFVSSSTNETFYGLPFEVIYDYDSDNEVYTGFFDENASILVPYTISLDSGTWLNITIIFTGTDKIAGDVIYMNFTILPQMVTHLIMLSNNLQQKFAGEFAFSVRLTDDFNVSIEGKNILFIVKDSDSIIQSQYTAVTNQEGIAEKTIQFDDTGEFTVEIVFVTSGIFAGVSSSDTDIDYEVRVVNYGILIIDNIQAILIGIGVVVILSAGIYRGYVVPKRNRQRKALLDIHRRFGDIENMQYVLIMHKETSTSIFSQTFTELPIDSTLISGFLSAISTFGKEIGNRVEDSQQNAFAAIGDKKTGLEELSYQQFKIVVIEGYYVRTAVLLLKSASPTLRSKIRQFNAEFETKYLSTVEHFSGQIPSPEPILELIEKTLFAYLLYPHNVIPSKAKSHLSNVKKKSTTALVIKEAESSFNNAFRLREMIVRMAGYGRKEVDTFNVIEKLRQEQVLFAVNPRTQYLIEQFKPMIDPLTHSERLVLKELYKSGPLSEKHLKKNTKIAIVVPIITSLLSKELINEGNSLTEMGEVIATLLNLMPDI
ncbi:carbohydrate porin [Promethearchaeum syntrophicum]|uniref:Carbohydrate porin n=1 Tax=Promethearchaeum syntrophicum TaxID=2594042 RepID=A0A5B9DCC9_9ARCH|nr:carbohydrate porin [Candidatus Prometheoarchaeum syntrophicum]QEE16527.1 hypothetical protein DSAG12_02357 [Candidatus Prometheoarchaeum syntrophicum]